MISRHDVANLLAALIIFNTMVFAKRLDPRNEAPISQIAKVLRQTQLVGVFCGDDVDAQTCKFFVNALRLDLKKEHVGVILRYQPEVLVQSFYVPPMAIPFTAVTLRLIEYRAAGQPETDVYLAGFCFDPHSQDQLGFQLPQWVESEGRREVGPLETDRARAASKLAEELSEFWIETLRPPPAHSRENANNKH